MSSKNEIAHGVSSAAFSKKHNPIVKSHSFNPKKDYDELYEHTHDENIHINGVEVNHHSGEEHHDDIKINYLKLDLEAMKNY